MLSTLPTYNALLKQTQIDLKNKLKSIFENILINNLNEDALTDYYSYPIDTFFDKHKSSLNNFEENICELLKYIDSSTTPTESLGFSTIPVFTNKNFVNQLKTEMTSLSDEQNRLMTQKLEEISNIDLNNFSNKLVMANKINYFSHCCKDYIKNPKPNGYQSLHIRICTPFGTYEKQIRTAEQDKFAEKGYASHANTYKPGMKNTFHRLKIPTPFSLKRDANGDIITPIELGVLPFESAVQVYYGVPFSMFSNGKTFEEFKDSFPTKEAFDLGMLALTPQDTSFFTRLKNKFSNKNTINTTNPTTHNELPLFDNIPTDIAVYNNAATTDDSDPYDNR